ncbi:MAG TPA: iron ABC transporter permease [Burkholderiaceae bacterium]|nr:iron ABC transporter permease [Burkholderiaceae bacterium]
MDATVRLRELPNASFLPTLIAAAVLCLLAALRFGSVEVGTGALLHALVDRLRGVQEPSVAATVLALRLPRALTGIAVGGLLALSGALLQSLLRNPLADPYVLGVSGGASCAAIVAIAFGAGAAAIALFAAGGAFAAMLLLFLLAHRALFARDAPLEQGRDTAILLTGVMIASLCAAALSLVLTLAPDGRLRTMVFWLLGDLGGAVSMGVATAAVLSWLLLLSLGLRDANALNLMLGGEVQAYTQGVATAQVRRRLITLTAVATGVAVALAGAVGFVGFVAPHLVRYFVGTNQRVVLPAASLLGAILVLLADTIGRSIAAPLQLPVGALTALVGVPVFLWQLQRP